MLLSQKFHWRPLYLYDLIKELVSRDMKILYKRSALGVAWTLLNPLLQLAVFSFVFRGVLSVDISRYSASYSSFAFSGLLVWTWFQTSLNHATGLITSNRPMIRLPGFPVPILPVVTVTTGMIHFLLALPVLLLFLAIDGVRPSLPLLVLPILLMLQFSLTLSLAYPLAAMNVTFRDTQHTLAVLLQMFFYVTPIFYDINSVPASIQWVYRLNPMVSLLEAYRTILLQAAWPDWGSLLGLGLLVAVALPLSYQIFKRQSQHFVEEL